MFSWGVVKLGVFGWCCGTSWAVSRECADIYSMLARKCLFGGGRIVGRLQICPECGHCRLCHLEDFAASPHQTCGSKGMSPSQLGVGFEPHSHQGRGHPLLRLTEGGTCEHRDQTVGRCMCRRCAWFTCLVLGINPLLKRRTSNALSTGSRLATFGFKPPSESLPESPYQEGPVMVSRCK